MIRRCFRGIEVQKVALFLRRIIHYLKFKETRGIFEMKVKVTTHWKGYKKKPKEVPYVRDMKFVKVETVDVKELAKIFASGRTIACGVHEPTPQMKKVIQEQEGLPKKQQERFYISSETFKEQQVFAVDIDDGNLTLEEIRNKMKNIDIPYAVIYKTFSYTEDDRRWRIVFVNDEVVYSEQDVKSIYTYLIWRLHSDTDKVYTDAELAEIDISGTDIARLTFGAKEVVEVNENAICSLLEDAQDEYNQVLADDFITMVRIAKAKENAKKQGDEEADQSLKRKDVRLELPRMNTETFDLAITGYIEALQEEFNSTGTIAPVDSLLLETLKPELTGKIDSTFLSVPVTHGGSLHKSNRRMNEGLYELSLNTQQLYEIICTNLKNLDSHLKPSKVDYTDRYLAINTLKITDLLRNDTCLIRENENIHCLLLHHDDSTPSATIRTYGKNGEFQKYRCHGCDTGYHTFDFIHHIFEGNALLQGRKHSIKDTLDLVYALLDVEVGSDYQKKCEQQINHDRRYIRDIDKETPFGKMLDYRKLRWFLMDLYDIADKKLSPESILNSDEENSLAFIAANTYISEYLSRLGRKGASQGRVNYKLNLLARIGLIEKVTFSELKPKERASMIKYKIKTLGKEAYELRKKEKYKDKDIMVYKIHPLSDSLIKTALERLNTEKKKGARAKGQGKSQTLALYGLQEAQAVYVNEKITSFTKSEEKYLELASKVIGELLKEQKYFIESDLDKLVDKHRNHFKASEKKRMRASLFPCLTDKFDLVKARCNKELRLKFGIPASVKCDIWFAK